MWMFSYLVLPVSLSESQTSVPKSSMVSSISSSVPKMSTVPSISVTKKSTVSAAGTTSSVTLSNDSNDFTLSQSLLLPVLTTNGQSSPLSSTASSLSTTSPANPSNRTPAAEQLNWWINLGPLGGTVLFLCLVIAMFLMGLLTGFLYKRKLSPPHGTTI